MAAEFRNMVLSLVVLVLPLLFLGHALGQPSRGELLKNSHIVFVGTVAQLGAVSFAGVPKSPNTLVVRVDEILKKPASVMLRPGDNVTVEAKDPSAFKEGVQATFYTEGWILGEGVAVREVGHETRTAAMAAESADQKGAELKKLQQENDDAQLRESLQTADMIVVGRVKSVGKLAMAAGEGQSRPVTEHDPDWRDAVIEVQSSIKGAEGQKNVVVRFPASLDVSWHDAPKFKAGQEGTFVLRKDQVSGKPQAMLAGNEVGTYTALRSKDVLPKAEAKRVRALANKP